MDKRWGKVKWGPSGTRQRTSDANWRQPLAWDRAAAKAGERHRVFCASLADVFEDNPQVRGWRLDLFNLIRRTPALDWLLLTKRPENIVTAIRDAARSYNADAHDTTPGLLWLRRWLTDEPPVNVWLGTSVENQEAADTRINDLLKCPAAFHFLSCEPLLGPLDLHNDKRFLLAPLGRPGAVPVQPGVDWVIIGAESGHGARPMEEAWARSIRDQCQAAGVAFFYKQRIVDGRKVELPVLDGRQWAEFPNAPVPA